MFLTSFIEIGTILMKLWRGSESPYQSSYEQKQPRRSRVKPIDTNQFVPNTIHNEIIKENDELYGEKSQQKCQFKSMGEDIFNA